MRCTYTYVRTYNVRIYHTASNDTHDTTPPVTLYQRSAAAGQWYCSKSESFYPLFHHQTQADCGTAATTPVLSLQQRGLKICAPVVRRNCSI